MTAETLANTQFQKSQFEIYIRNFCRLKGITIDALADKADIARGTFYNLLKPTSNPKLSHFVSLANAMNIHPQTLLQLKWHEFDLVYLQKYQPTVFDATHKQIDISGFVDETIPDGTIISAGANFTKSWTIQNIGQVTWQNRYLQCIDIEHPPYPTGNNRFDHCLRPQFTTIDIPTVQPLQQITLAINYTAPQIAGRHISYWKMFNEQGELCFPDGVGLYASIFVKALGVNYAQP